MSEVIIPIKALSAAKARLAGILSPAERAGLVLAMLEDVLGKVSVIEHCRVWVVASDEPVFDLAHKFGAQIVREQRSRGYNRAIRLCLAGIAERRPVAVIPGDVPLACPAELELLLAQTAVRPLVRIAPSRDRFGTNGLFMTSKHLLNPAFGPGSFMRHRKAAESAGVHTQVLELSGLAHDIDVPQDLADFQLTAMPGAASKFLRSGVRRSMAGLMEKETAA